jgi:hypothetical protein
MRNNTYTVRNLVTLQALDVVWRQLMGDAGQYRIAKVRWAGAYMSS